MLSKLEFTGTERFEVVRRLGAGGMGVVYEAWDRVHNSPVALKALREVNAQGLLRFKQEFRSLQHVAHPNLVRLGELIEDEGQWFFTMELVDGVDFLSYVRPSADGDAPQDFPSADTFPEDRSIRRSQLSRARLDESRLRRSFGQLVRGLIALHDASKVHRDIKPTNILVTEEGRVVILDFGLSIDAFAQGESAPEVIVGTAAYMAPEQAASTKVGPEADWYSAGVMLYEALTGQLPFEGRPIQILMDKQAREPVPPRELVPTVDRGLDALCVELLRKNPQDRLSGEHVLRRLGVDETGSHRALLGAQIASKPPFVGRVTELDALQQAFKTSRSGRAVAVLVRGESGMGKTELVSQFVDSLVRDDPRVVHLKGRCYERESLPYKGFDGIADSMSRHLSRLPDKVVSRMLPENADLLGRLFPVLLRVEAIARLETSTPADMNPHELRMRVFRVLRELFGRMAGGAPVVLVVDDFQWADLDSLTLLTELLHPPEPPPVLLIATVRSENPEVLDDFVSTMRPWGGDVRIVDVDPLADDSCEELVELLAPDLVRDAPDAIAAVVKETGGHPLFLQELVRHLQAPSGHPAGKTRLDDALWARISRLPEEARNLLETLCVASAPITQEVATLATKQSYETHERATTMLRMACLARTGGVRQQDTIESYHDRVREAVLARLDHTTQLHHHERLAIALERAGAGTYDPQVLVRHLEASGKSSEAARRAFEAARRASVALAFDRAADLFRAALRLGHPEESIGTLQRALADTLANAGRGVEAAEAYLVAAEHSDPASQVECRRLAAEQLLVSGHLTEGLAALRGMLDQLGIPLPESPKRALLGLLWCRFRYRLRGMRWKERHEREIAPAVLKRLDTYRVVGHALGMVDNIQGSYFLTKGLLAALDTGERRRVLLAVSANALYTSSQGGSALARGKRQAAKIRTMLTDQDDGVVHGWHSASEGIIKYFEGEFPEAAKTLDTAVRLFREESIGTAWELNTVRMFRMFALKHAGRLREVEQLYGTYLRNAEQRGDHYIETSTRRYGTFLWLARDQPDEARRNLAQTTWVPPEGRFHLQHWFELEAHGEISLYEGCATKELADTVGPVSEMKKSLLLRIQVIRCLSRWLRGRLLVASAAETKDASLLAPAMKLAKKLRKEKLPHATTWSYLLEAGIRARHGDEDGTVACLRAATEIPRPDDIALYVAAGRRCLGSLIGGDQGAELVADADDTMHEQRVANPERFSQLIVPGLERG